ncbi:Tripeptidyl-peptidase sed2 [Trichoderma lentiforme]|uniref:tripeptidyl-peptidase II n=1 Tax=Trichoderma lentiforme TaxID=1567552 RepID=A0A9P4XJT3_9HYPO|nr:Tripeptidyl-peptidase sed2 [Trichoderma lentiforme]
MRALLLFLGISTVVTSHPTAEPALVTREEVQQAKFAKVAIALQPDGRELLEQTLHQVSDPSSKQYGKYLSGEEAKALLRPRQVSTDTVKGWLLGAGIAAADIVSDGQFIHAEIKVEQAQSLLGSGYNSTLGSQTIPVSSLPEEVGTHVTTIQYAPIPVSATYPIDNLPVASPDPKQNQTEIPVDLKECNSTITPGCLRKLYHVGDYRAQPETSSLFGIVGFVGQSAQFDQITKFLNDYAPYAANASFSVESVNGGLNHQGNDTSQGEANADMEYAISLGYNIPVRFYATGGDNRDIVPDLDLNDTKSESLEPYLEFARHLLDLDDDQLPSVVSISYGANEQLFPKAYAQQVCDIFGQLGTRGVSIVVSSGDIGPGMSCQSNDGTKKQKFMPSFPATCPYVTSVGGTFEISPEIAANFSSGGFSDYFDRPKWQDETVGKYLELHGEEWKDYYNPTGRGFPDVAAQGVNFQSWSHGNESSFTGTSVSAPAFAALIALLNDHRHGEGRPSMGFLNPWIYSIGNDAFTDITESKSLGCYGISMSGAESPVIPNAGWSAVPGWDPVTGLGTPLFDKLLNLSCV